MSAGATMVLVRRDPDTVPVLPARENMFRARANIFQWGGRLIVQLFQTVGILSRALEDEKADRVRVEGQLVGEIHKKEAELIRVAQRVADLARQVREAKGSANEQRTRANGLEEQLKVEKELSTNLSKLLRDAQDQEYVLKGQVENAVALRNDIQRELALANSQITRLEQQIVNEREQNRKSLALKDLKIIREGLKLKQEEGTSSLFAIMGVGAAIGAGFGGPLGAAIGCVGGTVVALIGSDSGLDAKLKKIDEEIADMGNPGPV